MNTVPLTSQVKGSLLSWFERTSERRIIVLLGVALWLLAVWPVFVFKNLPYQDLPGHVAAAYVADHIKAFPDYIATSGLKTNSALKLWLSATAPWFGYIGAARVFVAMVLAVTAFGFVTLLTSLGGKRRAFIGSLFIAPFISHWYVATGMVNFSLSFALCLFILAQQRALREKWSYGRFFAVTILSAVAWVAHNFPLVVVALIAATEFVHAYWRDRTKLAGAFRFGLAVAPASGFVVVAALLSPVKVYASVPDTNQIVWSRPPALIIDLFRHFLLGPDFRAMFAAFCGLAVILLALLHPRRNAPGGFSGTTLVVLLGCYAFFPYAIGQTWCFFNARFVPFIWVWLIVRIPDELPVRWLYFPPMFGVLASLGSGLSYLRLDRELDEFRSGIPHVEHGAKLLPMIFPNASKGAFTNPFMHAWCYYTLERNTTPATLWTSRNVDVEYYRVAPPPRFHHNSIEARPAAMSSAETWCGSIVRATNTPFADCKNIWENDWHSFLEEAEQRYSQVLVWDAPETVLALITQHFPAVFRQGRVVIGTRREVSASSVTAVGPGAEAE